jgi:hypothetical protein
MLRPVRQPTAFVAGPSFQSIVQLVALTGGDTPGLPYLTKGITGGYSMTVLTTPFGDIRRQMSEFEQRTIRRFRIHLTAPEQIRLLQRIWELERRGYWAYFFFTDNCASNLILLLNSVLDPEREISVPGRFSPVFPSATLDFMSDVTVQSGESSQARTSLLEPVPDNFESTQDVARAADARREVLAPPLRAVFDTKLSTEFMHWHARSKYPDPVQRARAYEGLAQVFSLALTRAGTSWLGASLTYEYLFQTVRVERYAVDAAEAEALKARGAAQERLPRKTSDTFDEASLRQSTFQHEALLQPSLV